MAKKRSVTALHDEIAQLRLAMQKAAYCLKYAGDRLERLGIVSNSLERARWHLTFCSLCAAPDGEHAPNCPSRRMIPVGKEMTAGEFDAATLGEPKLEWSQTTDLWAVVRDHFAARGIDAEGQDPQGLGAEHESPTPQGARPESRA
jgi:hypothetical protein